MNMSMKIFLLLIILMVYVPFGMHAQSSANRLNFIYIDHETTTPVNKLCKSLKDLRDNAIETGSGLIVYLANNFEPIVSAVNVPNVDEGYLGDEAFDFVIAGLQEENSHDVDAKTDLRKILALCDQCGLNDKNMKLGYRSVTFDFYVGKSFWEIHNEVSLLSYLYFALDIPALQEAEVYFNIYKPTEDVLNFPENIPFGEKNIDNINQLRVMNF